MFERFLQRLDPSSLFGLFMLGSFGACVLLSGLIIGYQSRQALLEHQASSAEREIKVTMGYIEQALDERVELLRVLSRSEYIIGAAMHSGIDFKTIDDYLFDFKSRYANASIFIIDIDSDIIYSNVGLSLGLDVARSFKSEFDAILANQTQASVKLRNQEGYPSVLMAVPISYGGAVEGVLVAKLPLKRTDIFPGVAGNDRRILLSDGETSIASAGIIDESRWLWHEKTLRFEGLKLSYGFDTLALENQQTAVLQTTLLWLLAAFVVSFIVVYWIGRRVLLNPYKELDYSRTQLSAKAAELRASEQEARQLALVAENAKDSIIITDSDGMVLWVNKAFCELTGYRREEVLGRKPGHLLQGPETDPAAVEAIGEALAGGQRTYAKILNYTKTRQTYWVEMDIVPVIGNDGQVEKFIAIERDVTERTNLEKAREDALEAAESAARSKSQFLAMMSHEIRTPMNGVLGTLGLLDEMTMPDEQRELVAVARESGEFLLTILNDILDFSKLEAGKLQLEDVAFNLRQLIRGTVSICSAQAKAKRLTLTSDIAPQAPEYIIGDPGRIRQMLLNFLSNAIKFTEKGSVFLHVDARPSSGGQIGVCFSVEDTGMGIPDEKRNLLFQDFSQVDSSTARRFGGTGLGLAITKLLAQQMGGRVWCDSAVGKGSTFYFAAPFKSATKAEIECDSVQADGSMTLDQGNLKVLLAEDNRTNQMIAQSMLRGLGCRVDVAGNGLEAVQAVSERHYDLILMDIQMPDLDGVDATRRIRGRDDAMATIPIIALTANVMAEEKMTYLDAGMNDFIAKPVNKGLLVGAINRVLSNMSRPNVESEQDVTVATAVTPCSVAIGDPLEILPLFDENVLDKLLSDVDASMRSDLVEAVIGDLEKRSQQAEEALEQGDLGGLERACHSLVGCCSSFGLVRLQDLAKKMQQACQRCDEHFVAENSATLLQTTKDSIDICRRSEPMLQ